MDFKPHTYRPPSTNSLPPGSRSMSSTTPISSRYMPQYLMQPQYPAWQPHALSPPQPHHAQSPTPRQYMSQPYRPNLSRYPRSTHNAYGASQALMMPHTTIDRLPPTSMLEIPHPVQQQYPRPPSMLSHASTAQRYPQPIAPAPPRDRRPEFNGLPSGAFSYCDGNGWGMTPGVPGTTGSPHAKEQPCTPVVGPQGHRAMLPMVPRRATPVSNRANGTAKSTIIPVKDAHGKLPCPHCHRTYLHAKHLKRHILRREFI